MMPEKVINQAPKVGLLEEERSRERTEILFQDGDQLEGDEGSDAVLVERDRIEAPVQFMAISLQDLGQALPDEFGRALEECPI